MLNQIISNTPLFVWAILAFLIIRGVIALRTRELSMNKLFIMPAVMVALSLFGISAKFGLSGLALATWLAAAAATLALLMTYGAARIAPGTTAGRVIVRGSAFPLVLMMTIFMVNYITSVAVALHAGLRHDMLFTVVVCALFGVSSGYFLGRVARDLKAYRGFAAPRGTATQAV